MPEDKFLFLFSFDYLSVFKRKNPLAVIEAFTRAFGSGERVGLIIKCINHDRDPAAHAELRAAASAHPEIEVIDRYLDPLDNSSLAALCDCYVSLHRAEGFGFGPAEAMWLGKPVIATGYSGNLDFMTPENSLLVDYRLVPIGAGADPYPADAQWADPDIQHAASLMRGLFDDPERAQRAGRCCGRRYPPYSLPERGRANHAPPPRGDPRHRATPAGDRPGPEAACARGAADPDQARAGGGSAPGTRPGTARTRSGTRCSGS